LVFNRGITAAELLTNLNETTSSWERSAGLLYALVPQSTPAGAYLLYGSEAEADRLNTARLHPDAAAPLQLVGSQHTYRFAPADVVDAANDLLKLDLDGAVTGERFVYHIDARELRSKQSIDYVALAEESQQAGESVLTGAAVSVPVLAVDLTPESSDGSALFSVLLVTSGSQQIDPATGRVTAGFLQAVQEAPLLYAGWAGGESRDLQLFSDEQGTRPYALPAKAEGEERWLQYLTESPR
jgi:hypothetical protein